MRAKLITGWENLRSTYWFVPSLMTLFAIIAAIISVEVDKGVKDSLVIEAPWIYGGAADGARGLLSTVAGSMITVAGVTFSITIAALSLASSQFGPRLLRNFMRDTGNQVVLGTFISTFVYCLLILRTVRSVEEIAFVPHIAVTIAIGLALVSLGMLIFYIHHISQSIQVSTVINEVGHELDATINRLFPDRIGQDKINHTIITDEYVEELIRSASPVKASGHGYVQLIDADQIMHIATKHDLVIHLVHRPGELVMPDSITAYVYPQQSVTDEICHDIQSVFAYGKQRTPYQDIIFAIDQLVEIALRALSPGINDPFTAIACIDRLGISLCQMFQRELPSPYRFDEQNKLRVIAYPITYAHALDAAFKQIRLYGRDNAVVTCRLLHTIAEIAACNNSPKVRAALYEHAQHIWKDSKSELSETDYKEVSSCYKATIQALQKESAS